MWAGTPHSGLCTRHNENAFVRDSTPVDVSRRTGSSSRTRPRSWQSLVPTASHKSQDSEFPFASAYTSTSERYRAVEVAHMRPAWQRNACTSVLANSPVQFPSGTSPPMDYRPVLSSSAALDSNGRPLHRPLCLVRDRPAPRTARPVDSRSFCSPVPTNLRQPNRIDPDTLPTTVCIFGHS